jgi:hypothetical protein
MCISFIFKVIINLLRVGLQKLRSFVTLCNKISCLIMVLVVLDVHRSVDNFGMLILVVFGE